ncbi:MAG: DEAD/DEAH box helicase [Phycisphaeraceae bacterium]
MPSPDGDEAVNIRFTDLALPERLLSALAEDGYEVPSPIQAAIIPSVLAGRDVIGQAQTGTGKTAAFALPILAQLAADHEANHKHPSGPSALILTPTRELAIQVADAFAKYARKLSHINVLAVYGGADFRGQAIPLKRGVDIVVGTPGRVMDHMRRKTLDVSNIRTLVLDEADEMLRMGFVDDVEWVLSETPPGRQVALFSATMPGAIKAIAERQLDNPERIKIQGGSKTADTVRQRYWRAQGMTKVDALCRLLAHEPVDAALVFVRTREATSNLARHLQEAGFPAAPLSGDIAQSQRERTIEALRKGKLKLVVATDVAARGIDVKSISHVFNFDVPEDTEAYIHRIGRTGRAGRTGEAILFVENRQRRLLQNIERATGSTIEKMEMPTAEDIQALQLNRFAEQLKERLAFKGEKPKPAALRSFIEQICLDTGRDAIDIAAYLVGPAMKSTVGNAPTVSAEAPKPRPSAGRQEYSAPPSNFKRMPDAFEKYRVAVGGDDGVEVGNLVGAIANEAGIDGKAIGSVRIFKSHSTVELPPGMPAKILSLLQRTKVKGKALELQLFKPGSWSSPSSEGASASPKPRQFEKNKKPSTHRKGAGKPKSKSATNDKPSKSKPAKGAVKNKGKIKFKNKTKGKNKPKS